MNLQKLLYFYSILLILNSCATKKELGYFKDSEQEITNEINRIGELKLQPGDQLVINFMAPDNEVVKPFNQNYTSGKALQNVTTSGNAMSSTSTVSGSTYLIDSDGMIEINVIGPVNAKGLTVDELKEQLRLKVLRYVKEPTVSVRLTNFRISVMGEVARPGEFTIPDGNGTVLSALSMAGDLTIYGNRENVQLIRSVDGKIIRTTIDLTKSELLNSPNYALKQNDILYVSPNKTREKTSRLDPNAGIYISVASIVVTILALVFKK